MFSAIVQGFYGVYDSLFERLARQEGKVREERQVSECGRHIRTKECEWHIRTKESVGDM
jgi:hypothetical protein